MSLSLYSITLCSRENGSPITNWGFDEGKVMDRSANGAIPGIPRCSSYLLPLFSDLQMCQCSHYMENDEIIYPLCLDPYVDY